MALAALPRGRPARGGDIPAGGRGAGLCRTGPAQRSGSLLGLAVPGPQRTTTRSAFDRIESDRSALSRLTPGVRNVTRALPFAFVVAVSVLLMGPTVAPWIGCAVMR